MSQTYVSAIISLLAIFLPAMGVKIGTEQITVTVQTIIVIASQFWIMYRRYQVGDITTLGARK